MWYAYTVFKIKLLELYIICCQIAGTAGVCLSLRECVFVWTEMCVCVYMYYIYIYNPPIAQLLWI